MPNTVEQKLVLDVIERRLYVGDKPVAVIGKHFHILHLLARRFPKPMTWAEIKEAGWPGLSITSQAVSMSLIRLRETLGHHGLPELIQWERGGNGHPARHRLTRPIHINAPSCVQIDRDHAQEMRAWVAQHIALQGAARIQGMLDAVL